MTNPGTALNLDWLEDVRVNASAVSRRTQSLTGRRNVKGPWQTAWLLHASRCMDLTTLSREDTPTRVQRLCAKARQPVRTELLKSLGIES
ncbi:MAG: deoxyribose-phosphate aldolase, partial [SAR324 cluster bacterium]|nr:deoxyribose-phosphate aldolase [SAR324 cluster bacterium]